MISGRFILKIVKLFPMKTIESPLYGQSQLYPMNVKDIENSKTKLSIFINNVGEKKFEEGKVYCFDNLSTDKFPHQKPYYLKSCKETKVSDCSETIQSLFQSILHFDGTFEGR